MDWTSILTTVGVGLVTAVCGGGGVFAILAKRGESKAKEKFDYVAVLERKIQKNDGDNEKTTKDLAQLRRVVGDMQSDISRLEAREQKYYVFFSRINDFVNELDADNFNGRLASIKTELVQTLGELAPATESAGGDQ